MAYTVIACYHCAADDEASVRAALLKVREHTRAEPANLAYEVHSEVGESGSFVLYEQYADQAGFEAHKAASHFKELIVETVWPLLTDRSVTFAEVL
ncbi:putative quinol monooxygenase [Streptomyces justiciae]|uniref:putative quinol monooxygenase n=1 Tax=Streptomyces justiciae TaxID=2780140 RepID=UPI0018828667|nr:putative quinol monooxygenase [Streptomyces justiciae]MBE8477273.1 antibiotic biosynthesis monooxygenase [Streptomyces justiciae]MCW8378828.1 antibiotic biosynthesis monooxygenase [Streptomyces justiciae]